jgi:Ca-activated chloride channel family protein
MSGLLLLRPLWLLALIPVVAVALGLRRRRQDTGWAAVVDAELLPVLRRLGLLSDRRGDRLALLPLAAAGMLCVALSGPAVERPDAVAFKELDPLILVLDLSPSVVADMRVLGDLQVAAVTLLGQANGRPVGVMVYAADAYLASAPTSDAASLQGLIAVIDRETMPVAGSRPDIALSMARDLFADRDGPGLGGADLVVISDGGGAGPRAVEEAARLSHDGARVWALSLSRSATGAPPADPGALAALAAAGGGAELASAKADEMSARIAAARTARLVRDPLGESSFRDLGPWVLPLAMLPVLPLFRRRR